MDNSYFLWDLFIEKQTNEKQTRKIRGTSIEIKVWMSNYVYVKQRDELRIHTLTSVRV